MLRSHNYNTKQGNAVLNCIASLNGRHITVDEIAANLSQNGNSVGIATIYRWLEKLEQNGIVRKLFVDGVSGACFQYVTEAAGFHLMCARCGRLDDLKCNEVIDFENHVLQSHDFRIDTTRTVLYGKCAACAENEGK